MEERAAIAAREQFHAEQLRQQYEDKFQQFKAKYSQLLEAAQREARRAYPSDKGRAAPDSGRTPNLVRSTQLAQNLLHSKSASNAKCQRNVLSRLRSLPLVTMPNSSQLVSEAKSSR